MIAGSTSKHLRLPQDGMALAEGAKAAHASFELWPYAVESHHVLADLAS